MGEIEKLKGNKRFESREPVESELVSARKESSGSAVAVG